MEHPLDGPNTNETIKSAEYAVDYHQTSAFVHCYEPAIENFVPDEKTPFKVKLADGMLTFLTTRYPDLFNQRRCRGTSPQTKIRRSSVAGLLEGFEHRTRVCGRRSRLESGAPMIRRLHPNTARHRYVGSLAEHRWKCPLMPGSIKQNFS
jgi:hypothetical protein